MIPRNKITLISSSQGFSGSIERIQALGDPATTSSLGRIEYGNMDGNLNSFTASSIINTTIDVPNGSEILGPIGRIQSTGSSNWLVYFK